MIKNLRNPPDHNEPITAQQQSQEPITAHQEPITAHPTQFFIHSPATENPQLNVPQQSQPPSTSVPEQQQNDSCTFNMSPNLPLPNYRTIIANPPICPNQQQQFQQQQQQGMNLLNYSISALSNGTNPYVPPAVEQKSLKKAQKQEYIELDTLLPLPASVTTDNCFGFEFDTESNLMLKASKPKHKITNLSSWMCAWNVFTQMTLHYHPDTHFLLFSYLKAFCNLTQKFKFEHCYMYDKAQRKQIASQAHLPSLTRTAHWDKLNDELFNAFLRDSSSQLPLCYHCYSSGHYASHCPFKSNTQPQSSFRPQQQQTQWASSSNITTANRPTNNNTSNHIPSRPKPSSDSICFRYNNTGFCAKPPCSFRHICRQCQKPGHPQSKCMLLTSTTFRP